MTPLSVAYYQVGIRRRWLVLIAFIRHIGWIKLGLIVGGLLLVALLVAVIGALPGYGLASLISGDGPQAHAAQFITWSALLIGSLLLSIAKQTSDQMVSHGNALSHRWIYASTVTGHKMGTPKKAVVFDRKSPVKYEDVVGSMWFISIVVPTAAIILEIVFSVRAGWITDPLLIGVCIIGSFNAYILGMITDLRKASPTLALVRLLAVAGMVISAECVWKGSTALFSQAGFVAAIALGYVSIFTWFALPAE